MKKLITLITLIIFSISSYSQEVSCEDLKNFIEKNGEEMHYQKISNTTPELLFEVFEMIFDEIGKEHKEAIIKHVTT